MDFKKREKISSLIGDALVNREGGYLEASKGISDGVKTAIAYINNCKNDIRVSEQWRICVLNILSAISHGLVCRIQSFELLILKVKLTRRKLHPVPQLSGNGFYDTA